MAALQGSTHVMSSAKLLLFQKIQIQYSILWHTEFTEDVEQQLILTMIHLSSPDNTVLKQKYLGFHGLSHERISMNWHYLVKAAWEKQAKAPNTLSEDPVKQRKALFSGFPQHCHLVLPYKGEYGGGVGGSYFCGIIWKVRAIFKGLDAATSPSQFTLQIKLHKSA
jgi:hypothetical protein